MGSMLLNYKWAANNTYFVELVVDLNSREMKKHKNFKIVLHENVFENMVKLDSLGTSFQRHK